MKKNMSLNLNKQTKNIALYSAVLSVIILIFGVNQSFAAGVSLSATPNTQTVNVGQTATYTIKINRDGFADKVTLSATGLPSGATATFSPNTTTAISSVLTVKTLTTTPIGIFNISVKGTANGITIAPITVKLTTKPQSSMSISVNPEIQSIVAGQTAVYDIAINRTNFDGAVMLSVDNAPSELTVIFEPQNTTGNSTRMYIYSNRLPFLPAEYSMIVRAQSNGLESFKQAKLVANRGISWAEQFGVPNNQTSNADFATDVTYDSAGNVYVAGYSINVSNNFDTDSWVAKYDSVGNQLWVRNITNLTEDRATKVVVDTQGNVYIAGVMRRTDVAFVNYDIFIAKYNANGTQVVSPNYYGTNHEEGTALHLRINASGNLILTAATDIRRYHRGNDSDGRTLYAAFFDVTRYTLGANLNGISIENLVNDTIGNPKELKVANDGSIYILKEDLEMVDSGFYQDVTVSVQKLNAQGGQLWQTSWFDVTPNAQRETNSASGLTVDSSGNVTAVGNIDSVRFMNRPQTFRSWMMSFNSGNGSLRWQKGFNWREYKTEINALDVDSAGNVYYVGYTFDSLVGTNPNRGIAYNQTEGTGNMNARSDAYVGKLNGSNSNDIWLEQFNVDNKDGFNALRVKSKNNILLAGYTAAFRNVNYGYEDSLLMHFLHSSIF